MKVFLCGGGSGKIVADAMIKFESLLDKSKPLLYVPLAMESSRYDNCWEWITNEMSLINVTNIEMVTSGNDLFSKNLDDYCAIFIGGGNTYKLLKDLKDSKSFDKIKDFINNDGIVFGGSAGAIIFGKDINSCKMQDENDVELEDTEGFNIIKDYSLLCHLNRNDGIKFNRNKNSDYLLDFSKENKTIYLPDDDTIFVTDDEIKIIGNSDYEVYNNRKCEIVINDKKGANIMIRPANINDAKNIIELNIKEWKNTYKGIFPSEYLDNLDNLKEETIFKCQDKIHEYVVFEEDNKILGFIKYGNNRHNYLSEYGEIHALYVLSESQKNGIGKQLINYVLENNKGKYKYFLVATLATNSANVFYKKYGFKKIEDVYFKLNGKRYEENLYCIEVAYS